MTERLMVRTAAVIVGAVSLAAAGLALGGHRLVGGWLQLDAASGVLLAVNGGVGMFSAWLSPSYLVPDRHGLFSGSHRWYYLGLFLFWAALLAIPLTSNLGIAWLLVEATTGASAVLIAHSGRRRALEAGWKYLVLTTLGLTVALLGVLYLYSALTGFGSGLSTLDWSAIGAAIRSVPPATTNVAAVLIVAGFAAKIGWAPVHHWLPDAHSEAPAPVSAMLSAALLPTVMLVVWRLESALTGTPAAELCRELFIGFGLASLAVSVPFLWQSLPAKRLLAYSSLEHIGILAIGIGFGSPLALAGVVLHVWGHAAAKALGFYATIPLYRVQRTAPWRPASGVARIDRGTAFGLGVSLGALSGLPPSPIFFSELLILAGGFAAGQYLVATAAALLLALGFVGLAHQLIEALLGRPHRIALAAEEAA
jgi:hydrogenase-4 component F